MTSRGTFVVVGLGSMGTRRVQHCLKKGYKIIGYDSRFDRNFDANRKLGIGVFESFIELDKYIKDHQIKGMFICTPPAEHFRYIQYCDTNDISFMIEQPVVHSISQVKLLRQMEVNRRFNNNISIHGSQNLRYCQSINFIKDLIDNDKISRILSVIVECSEYLPDWHPWEPYTDYYPSSIEMGGGLDVICDIDWLMYLFGIPFFKRVHHTKSSSLNINTPDIADFLLEFTQWNKQYTRNDSIIVNIHEDFLQHKPVHTAKFITEKECVFLDFIENSVRIYNKDKDETINLNSDEYSEYGVLSKDWAWAEESYFKDTMVFLDKVERGDTSIESFDDAILKAQRVIESLNL